MSSQGENNVEMFTLFGAWISSLGSEGWTKWAKGRFPSWVLTKMLADWVTSHCATTAALRTSETNDYRLGGRICITRTFPLGDHEW